MQAVEQPSPSLLKPTYPDRTLAWIKDRLAEVYAGSLERQEQQKSIDRALYLQIYNTVQSYCKAVFRQQGEEHLYRSLELAIRAHCQESLRGITGHGSCTDNDQSAAGIVSAYSHQWKAFSATSFLVRNLLAYLQKTWITKAIENGGEVEGVFPVRRLHFVIWREEVLGVKSISQGSTAILRAVEQEQQKEQLGETDQSRLDDLVASLAEVEVVLSNDQFVVLNQ